ncbi:uncharacterized protein LOC142357932, partial [Convolutriloba macropyga]|uniref:uncharacterized protein LOC142357932 n=1 Tax=Convolutriloba macropyga TaxID=536237 RepID=UPI003F51F7EC
ISAKEEIKVAEGSRAKTPIETTGGGGVTDLSTGAKGAGAASPGGAQSPSGENDYYATLRDASQDSPTRRRQTEIFEQQRREHYSANYVEFGMGKELAEKTMKMSSSGFISHADRQPLKTTVTQQQQQQQPKQQTKDIKGN